MPPILDPSLLKTRMTDLGLTEADVAEKCRETPEAVRRWFAGESVPRPGALLRLLPMLHLTFEEVFGPPPKVATIVHFGDQAVSEAMAGAAEDCAYALRTLTTLLPADSLFDVPRLRTPVPAEGYAQSVAATLRRLADAPGPVPPQKLLQVLRGLGVVLVPSFGAESTKMQTAFAVYVAKTDRRFLVVNLSVSHAKLSYALAEACGYFLAHHVLSGEELTLFCRALADSLAPLGAEAEAVPTFNVLFGESAPAPRAFVSTCESWFQTPIYEAMRKFQAEEGGRNHAFVARTFCIGIMDGYGLSGVLLPGLNLD